MSGPKPLKSWDRLTVMVPAAFAITLCMQGFSSGVHDCTGSSVRIDSVACETGGFSFGFNQSL